MDSSGSFARRDLLKASAAVLGAAALQGTAAGAAEQAAAARQISGKELRIGVISATRRGKTQKRNGHTWHFAQYFHPVIDLDAFCGFVDPGSATFFRGFVRNPKHTFDVLPFADTRITHY
jgi:hypothetical protein